MFLSSPLSWTFKCWVIQLGGSDAWFRKHLIKPSHGKKTSPVGGIEPSHLFNPYNLQPFHRTLYFSSSQYCVSSFFPHPLIGINSTNLIRNAWHCRSRKGLHWCSPSAYASWSYSPSLLTYTAYRWSHSCHDRNEFVCDQNQARAWSRERQC